MMPATLFNFNNRKIQAFVLWFAKLLALIRKEFLQIYRDPSTWMVAVGLPIIFLLLFGFGISLDVRVLKLGILPAGGGKQGLELAGSLAHSKWFHIFTPSSLKEAEIMMRDSQIQGILLFRENFSRMLNAKKAGKLELLVDGSEPNTARFLELYTETLITERLNADKIYTLSTGAQIDIDNRVWFNPTAKSEYFLIPGAITVIMTLIGTLLTSLVFAREWERGTIEVLYTTPVTRMQILLGKLVPYFCLGLFAMSLCSIAAVKFFQIPFRGSISTLFVLSSIFLLSALGQGLLISITLKRQLIAAEAGLYSGFLPSLLLSGFVFDIESMPYPLQIISSFLPATWFNKCIRTLFLAGDDWNIFFPCLLWLSCLAFCFLGIVHFKITKRLN